MEIQAIADMLSEFKTKQISCNRIAVYTSNNRNELLLAIHKKIAGSIHIDKPISISSIGGIKTDNILIVVKPLKVSYPGLDNEHYLYDMLKYHTNPKPVNVVFRSSNKEYKIDQVAHANLVISSVGNRKADISLINTHGDIFSISLKQDDAEIWESSDSYFAEEAASIIRNSPTLLHDNGSYFRIDPQIAVKATREENRKVIFGNDIFGNGRVLIRTFKNVDFERIGGTLYITVSKIIKDLRCLNKEHQVYFLIRNDKARRGIPGYPGIRSVAAFQSRISGNCLFVDRTDKGEYHVRSKC